MEWIIVSIIVCVTGLAIPLAWHLLGRLRKLEQEPHNVVIEDKPPRIIEKHIPVSPDFRALEKTIGDLPHKVLQSLQGSTNNMKGNLGEYMSYLKLSSTYDRVICLGNIVDFICIKFPSEESAGVVDFIDIKTGTSARLSKDQTKLKKLIEAGYVNFVKVSIRADVDVKPVQSN